MINLRALREVSGGIVETLFSIHECEKCLLIRARSFTPSFNPSVVGPTFLLLCHVHVRRKTYFIRENKLCGNESSRQTRERAKHRVIWRKEEAMF